MFCYLSLKSARRNKEYKKNSDLLVYIGGQWCSLSIFFRLLQDFYFLILPLFDHFIFVKEKERESTA